MISIQRANINSALKRMETAQKRGDKAGFYMARDSLSVTLKAIENVDNATYGEFAKYMTQDYKA